MFAPEPTDDRTFVPRPRPLSPLCYVQRVCSLAGTCLPRRNRKSRHRHPTRRFRESGGLSRLVPVAEWERMMLVRDYHGQHKNTAGFTQWFEQAKLLSGLVSIVQLLRLDLLARPAARESRVIAV